MIWVITENDGFGHTTIVEAVEGDAHCTERLASLAHTQQVRHWVRDNRKEAASPRGWCPCGGRDDPPRP